MVWNNRISKPTNDYAKYKPSSMYLNHTDAGNEDSKQHRVFVTQFHESPAPVSSVRMNQGQSSCRQLAEWGLYIKSVSWVRAFIRFPASSYAPTTCAVVQDSFLLKYQLGLKQTIDGILAFAENTTLGGPLWAMLPAQNGAPVVFVRLLMTHVIKAWCMLARNYWHLSLKIVCKSIRIDIPKRKPFVFRARILVQRFVFPS